MRIVIDVPSDIEQALLEKCESLGLTPSEFILSLLDWYFLRRKSKNASLNAKLNAKTNVVCDYDDLKYLSEFIKVANKCAEERIKYCKYSDGRYCAREVFEDILEEKEPERITPYKCLFCPYFVDRRKEKMKKVERDIADKTYDIAKLAATMLFEMYGDKLGYRPKVFYEVEEEKNKGKKRFSESGVKKLLDW